MAHGEYSGLLKQIHQGQAEHLDSICWRVTLSDGKTLMVRADAARWTLHTILPRTGSRRRFRPAGTPQWHQFPVKTGPLNTHNRGAEGRGFVQHVFHSSARTRGTEPSPTSRAPRRQAKNAVRSQ
jgi:hypothetical protein